MILDMAAGARGPDRTYYLIRSSRSAWQHSLAGVVESRLRACRRGVIKWNRNRGSR
jgi:hypothetical protein